MSELKPCPFCGGEAKMMRYWNGGYGAECADENCKGFWNVAETEQEAIAAWNTRAELTCNMTWHYSDNGGSAYTCSNCGMDTYPFSKSFEHCPHCTARVVE